MYSDRVLHDVLYSTVYDEAKKNGGRGTHPVGCQDLKYLHFTSNIDELSLLYFFTIVVKILCLLKFIFRENE